MAKKNPNDVVQDVLHGLYGVGEARKQRLRDDGYSWIEIQSLINKQYGSRSVAASNDEIAQELKEGRWGEEAEWENRVTAAGFNWASIAPLVKSTVAPTTSSDSAPSQTSTPSYTTPISTTVQAKGIDISAWQGTIDFNKVKAAGVEFVIIREGYGQTIDAKFLEYVNGAKTAGIPIHGVYHFCYSTTKEGAIQEAQSCITNVIRAGLPRNTIIFFDFEYDTVNNARKKGVILTKNDCISFTNAFLTTIASKGYRPGVYCNLDYYKNMYDTVTVSKYILWIAQYTKGNPMVMGAYHQYSDQGRINGINADVDLNTCYIKNAAAASPASDTPPAKPELPDDSSNTSVPNTSNPTTSLADFTKYNGKISNCGKDEYGGISGGRAGDQSGKEWWIINWYSQGWQCVLRHPDRKVREYIAELGIEAAENDKVGYDQSENRTYWQQLQAVGYWPKKITVPCEADCSAGVTSNVKAVGYLLNIEALKNVNITYTGAMRAELRAAGFQVLTDRKYLTSSDYLLPGDIILNDAQHTATSVGYGKYMKDQASTPSAPEVPSNPNEHKVIPAMLNVRISPGLGGQIVGQLAQGTLVTIKQTVTAPDGSKWYQIDQGYVASQYIT